jgi:hypothetical protein
MCPFTDKGTGSYIGNCYFANGAELNCEIAVINAINNVLLGTGPNILTYSPIIFQTINITLTRAKYSEAAEILTVGVIFFDAPIIAATIKTLKKFQTAA